MSQNNKKEVKYAVQYAYDNGVHTPVVSYSSMKIVVDTKPISRQEALKIFNEHRGDFIKKLKEDMRPNLVVWEDVGDGEFPIYGKTVIDLDYDCEVLGDKISKVETKRTELEFN